MASDYRILVSDFSILGTPIVHNVIVLQQKIDNQWQARDFWHAGR